MQGSWAREGNDVSLHYDIQEGPRYDVGTIEIAGVAAVDTPVVAREIYLQEGELFRRSDLRRSIEGLYDTGLFQVVDVAPSRVDTVEAIVDLDVQVRERKHKRLEGGVGFGTADGFRLLAAWSNVNLWGKAHQLNAQSAVWFGGLGRFQNRVAYTDPWLFGSRLAGGGIAVSRSGASRLSRRAVRRALMGRCGLTAARVQPADAVQPFRSRVNGRRR